jgi:hypothetical protein
VNTGILIYSLDLKPIVVIHPVPCHELVCHGEEFMLVNLDGHNTDFCEEG